jgi:catechol 2,3-dioxygenase-like lactoylglutathione lyase family enzyme
MRIEGLDTVFVWVTDLDRSLGWYAKLGLEPGPQHGTWQPMVLEGDAVFALHEGRGDHTRVNAVVGLRIDDLDAAIAELAAAGIEPLDSMLTDTGQRRFTTFVDPDGNQIQLIELSPSNPNG